MMVGPKREIVALLVAVACLSIAGGSFGGRGSVPPAHTSNDFGTALAEIDAHLETRWSAAEVEPVERADDLTILRRLSLALLGTIPSLEEIRTFEAAPREDRIPRWIDRYLDDRRFAVSWAERWAPSLIGTDVEPVIVFRRNLFVRSLADKLAKNAPYDQVVRDILSQQGLPTDRAETNFITAALLEGQVDANKLAGRTVRAFLGQRIDCAECHDHPFAHWRQSDFRGLSAFFAETTASQHGVRDHPIQGSGDAVVPFGPEWLPSSGTRRERLARWVTHPENRRFVRATANRVFALLFGRPYVAPIDAIDDPSDIPDLLDIVGADFVRHGFDLRRMIALIARSRAFQLASRATDGDSARRETEFAAFPLTPVAQKAIVDSLIQASSITTFGEHRHLLARAVAFLRERSFIDALCDIDESTDEERLITIAEVLLRMNGRLPSDLISATPFSSTGRIATFAHDDRARLEALYLIFLTRRPSAPEADAFLPLLARADGRSRGHAIEDIAWGLVNSAEFAWNH
jgi:hypothetical protein